MAFEDSWLYPGGKVQVLSDDVPPASLTQHPSRALNAAPTLPPAAKSQVSAYQNLLASISNEFNPKFWKDSHQIVDSDGWEQVEAERSRTFLFPLLILYCFFAFFFLKKETH